MSSFSKILTICLLSISVLHATTENQELISKFEADKIVTGPTNAEEQCNLGYYYISNRQGSTHDDLQKACYWFCESAKHKNIIALKELVNYSAEYPAYFNSYSDMLDFQGMREPYIKAACDSLQTLANQGDAEAQCCLGYYEKDIEKAFHWYSKAAAQENARAQYELGFFYETGIGTVKDEKESFHWYSKAANNGYDAALVKLGMCYQFGMGTEKNLQKAFEWCLKSAERGDAKSQYTIARYYELCIGNEIDYNLHDTISFFDTISPEKAFYWYSKAADQRHEQAQCSLGRCYELGVGTEVDKQKAFYWYQKAAEQKCVAAQYNLSRCYQRGIGTKVDLERAKHWKSEFEQTVTFGSEIDY